MVGLQNLSFAEKNEKQRRRRLDIWTWTLCYSCSTRTILLSIFIAALTAFVSIREVSYASILSESAATSSKLAESSNTEQVREQLKAMGLFPIYDPKTTTDPWKVELFQRLDRIRTVCGLLCQLNTVEAVQEHTVPPVPGAVLPMLKIEHVDCPAILGSEDIDAGDRTTPHIPAELLPYYTFQGKLKVTRHRIRKDIFLGGKSDTSLWSTGNVWKEDDINEAVRKVGAGTLKGSYGIASTTLIRDVIGELPLRGKSVLVIGSSHPWVEVILLHHGAAKVTTLEYGTLFSDHPQIKTMLPSAFRQQFLAGTLESFDGVVSHSSIEHSGLGRYGDALNPWGDILTVARAWCVTKEGGFMYLGLPTGSDIIMSNWHRTYGAIRWPLVAANWQPLPSKSSGAELEWNLNQAMENGGFGYLFTKTEPTTAEPTKAEPAKTEPNDYILEPATNKAASTESVREKLEALGLTPIYDPDTTNDPWKVELFQRLDRIRIVCGMLCQLNAVEAVQKYTVPVPGAVLPMLKAEPVDCPAILGLEELDAADDTAPPIPVELLPFYTFNNTLQVTRHKIRKDIYLGGKSDTSLWVTGNVWNKDDINEAVRQAGAGTLKGTYGVAATTLFRDIVGELPLREKSVLVIGSSHPWVEVILLHHGAAKVTTLEYGTLYSEHPQIKTMLPSAFRQQFLAGTLESFDGVVSHSSIEHSGLGRYGDALNPWGDILTVARAWCVTKQGGFMYLGLPTGSDIIMSNWHRTYGAIRWPLVAANWQPLPSNSSGAELSWNLQQAMKNGGFGYMFTKP